MQIVAKIWDKSPERNRGPSICTEGLANVLTASHALRTFLLLCTGMSLLERVLR